MVALEGREPVAVLLGAKRAEATLVHTVSPCTRRIAAAATAGICSPRSARSSRSSARRACSPRSRPRATRRSALFRSCRWQSESRFVDWRRDRSDRAPAELPVSPIAPAEALGSGLLAPGPRSWRRDLPSLARQADELVGLGFHSPDRLEACLLATSTAAPTGWEILAAGLSDSGFGRLGLGLLLDELERRAGGAPLRLSRVTPEEVDPELLVALGFRRGPEHLLFATEARAA